MTLTKRGASPLALTWLALLALLLAANAWLFTGAFASLPSSPPDYIVIVRPLGSLLAWWLAALGLLLVAYLTVARRDASAFGALLLLALPPIGMLVLTVGVPWHVAPVLYLFVDLRWWIWAAAMLLTVSIIARSSAGTVWRSPSVPVLSVALAALLLATALLVKPSLRFTPDVNGDEPKYLRYLETWYRGRGMDITGLVPIDQLQPQAASRLWANVSHAARAAGQVFSDLRSDAQRALGLPAPPAPRAAFSQGGQFVEGRHGGVYQVHNPGMSLLLLPGYLVDRAYLNADVAPAAGSQFPRRLFATGALILVMYVLWGLRLFQVAATSTSSRIAACVAAGTCMLSLPAIAFSYQFYPEASGGLFIALAAGYVLGARGTTPLHAFLFGFISGYLPWMHLRYAVLSVVFGVIHAAARRSERTVVVAFWCGLAVPLALLSLYTYYITGSLMPSRMWTLLVDRQVFNAWGVPFRVVGLFFDANWGAIAHAPVYLLAFAGFVPLWRHSRRAAVLVAISVVALAVPVAGHDWTGGGTTAARLIAGVLVLLALPLAEALSYFRRSALFLAAFAVLAAMSIDNGLRYNAHFNRAAAAFNGPDFSGWLSRLAFPYMDVAPERNWLLVFWMLTAAALLFLPMLRRSNSGTAPMIPAAGALTLALLMVMLVSTAIAAWTGFSSRTRFMPDPEVTREHLLRFSLGHRGVRVWSASRGPSRLEDFFPHPSSIEVKLLPGPTRIRSVDLPIDVDVRGADGSPAWGVAMIDFGDGSEPARQPILGHATFHHTFARPGQYQLSLSLSAPGAGSINRRELITIAER